MHKFEQLVTREPKWIPAAILGRPGGMFGGAKGVDGDSRTRKL